MSSSSAAQDGARDVTMSRELNAERQQAVFLRAERQRTGKILNHWQIHTNSVAVAAAVVAANITFESTPTPPNPKSFGLAEKPAGAIAIKGAQPKPFQRFFGISSPALQGALCGAATAIASGLIVVGGASTPQERAEAWREMSQAAVKSFVAGGMAGYMANAIYKGLMKGVAMMSSVEQLTQFAAKIGTFAPGLAYAGVEIISQAVCGLYHTILRVWASHRGDDESAALSQKKVDEIFCMDNAVKVLARCLGQAVAISIGVTVTVSTGGAAAFATLAAPVACYYISDALAQAMLDQKNQAGGWGAWISSWFIDDRRPYCWAGDEFEESEHLLPHELKCAIDHSHVVDPVRSTLTGELYERRLIYAWVDRNGSDPTYRGERVTRLDYIEAPVAKRWAHLLARENGAVLVEL